MNASPTRRRLLVNALTLAGSAGAVRATFAQPGSNPNAGTPPSTEQRALHVLNRLGFGPRPGDVERVTAMGIDRYIEQQLAPQPIALPAALATELDALLTLQMRPGELMSEYQIAVARLQAQGGIQPPAQPVAALASSMPAAAAPSAANIGDPMGASPYAMSDIRANGFVAQAPGARPAAQSAQVTASPGNANSDPRATRRQVVREVAVDSIRARLLRAIDSPRQLEEVMVDFWFNHFNVFIGKALDRVLVGHYEQHAIRPHAMGRFRDLLGATARHPAMLYYLDNVVSVAPGFQPPRRAAANNGAPPPPGPTGLNENYARELMELHTLGVDGGYSQSDVTELARIFTGWVFDRRSQNADVFQFAERRHDWSVKQWLGYRVEASGLAEGEWALDVLAAHPATARHIAGKLAQHFVADAPPRSLVDRLASTFTQSGGDIRQALRVLFDSPEFWSPASRSAKFKTPYQYVVSSVRAAGISMPANVLPIAGTLSQLGMPLFGCQTPDGYKNTEAAWLNAEAMTRRIAFATALAAGRIALNQQPPAPGTAPVTPAQVNRAALNEARPVVMPPVDWQALLATIGPGIGGRTRQVVEASEPSMRAALLLGSPEFMRH